MLGGAAPLLDLVGPCVFKANSPHFNIVFDDPRGRVDWHTLTFEELDPVASAAACSSTALARPGADRKSVV